MRRSGLASCLVAILTATVASAQPDAKSDAEYFTKTVRPVLEKNCFACHSHAAGKSKGQLVLDSRGALLKGGESGPAFDPAHPDKSLIARAISYTDDDLRMPPKGKLSAADADILRAWLAKGAPYDKASLVAKGHVPGVITDADRAWWAYQPVRPGKAPDVKNADWNKNPIDRFLFARLDKEGLTPSPPAERAVLIRRLTFDLTGLPPTPAEVDAFLRDQSPNAYESLVDRLLASPRYGERMARLWLDVVRFAETDGFRADGFRPNAWRYRDYVIRSFQSDKPYNRFLSEQIAGDELDANDPDCLLATGFLAAGIYEWNQRDVRTQQSDLINELVDVTADAFLAQGLGCARCHDHKYDPILQKDYLRFRAFFEPIVLYQETPLATPKQKKEYDDRLADWRAKTAAIRAKIDAIEEPERKEVFAYHSSKFPDDVKPIFKSVKRTPADEQLYRLAFRQIAFEYEKLDQRFKGDVKDRLLELRKELAKFDSLKPPPLPLAHLARDVGRDAPPTVLPRKSAEKIDPGFLSVLDPSAAKVTPTAESTGRRRALADWIAKPENPLTARVMVNRLWQMHFGRGLVATANDFGRLGEPPSHPELLDWLADSFVKNGWSIKAAHRLMVTSQAYRQSSLDTPENSLRKDPDNRLVSRAPSRRLDAEQVRDALLFASGTLDLKAGGPSSEPREPRRSIYIKMQRNTRDPLLDVFDWPEGFRSSAQRNVTTTPTQSLFMLNAPLVQQHARTLADATLREKLKDDAAVVNHLFRRLFGRSPTAAETKITTDFLDRQRRLPREDPKAAPVEHAKLPLRDGRAVVLTPGEVPVRMTAAADKVPLGDFTLEAFIVLRSTFEDSAVRTLASLWDGDMKSSGGWSFGVTSKKSSYKPQMLVLQLWGEAADGKQLHEPVFSSLALALNKPYYVAVSVKLGDAGEKGITFYAKDLTNDDEPMQVYQTNHKVTKILPGTKRFAIGGADAALERSWDGLIDDVRLSSAALTAEQLLPSADVVREDTVGYWQFEKTPGSLRDSSPNGLDLTRRPPAVAPLDPRTAALIDLCVSLLNANEFLYVD